MTVLLSGLVVLGAVYWLFVIKQRSPRIWLARLAYSRFIARLAVLGTALIALGLLLLLDEVLNFGDGPSAIGLAGS